MLRASRMPAVSACKSYWVRRKLKRIAGAASGSGRFNRTLPRASGRRSTPLLVKPGEGPRAAPRQLHTLRRGVDPAADDDFAARPRDLRHAVAQKLDAARPALLDENARRMRVGADR